MKAFFGYTFSALIISVIVSLIVSFFPNRSNDKEQLVSNLQLKILDVFYGKIDTGTQLMHLESVSRALNTESCTSNDLGIYTERKWVSDLKTLVNYRRAVEKKDYLITQASIGSSDKDEEKEKLKKQAREFIERFNESLWRHSYEPVLMSYESEGEILMVRSDEDVRIVEIPGGL